MIPILMQKRVGTTKQLVGGNYLGVQTITADATAHTKGPWTELIASTSGPGSVVYITAYGTAIGGTNTSMLLDIGIGAAGSEVVKIPNVNVGFMQGSNVLPGRHWRFPIFVPSGSRISARCQAAIVSDTVSVGLDVYGGSANLPSFAKVTAYGPNTVTSRGVTVTAPATVNTKGAWVVISSSTAEEIKAMVLAIGAAGLTGIGTQEHLIDIGYGAVGSEKVIAEDIFVSTSSNEYVNDPEPDSYIPLETPIPVGSRLVARHASPSANDANIDVSIYGLR